MRPLTHGRIGTIFDVIQCIYCFGLNRKEVCPGFQPKRRGRIINAIGNVEYEMEENWEKQLACAIGCQRCGQPLQNKDQRLLSVYDHQPICMSCKAAEEKRPDYEDVSRRMITECMEKTNKPYGDPSGD